MDIQEMLEDLEKQYTIYTDESLPFRLRLEVIKEFRTELKSFFKLVLEIKSHLASLEDKCEFTDLGKSEYLRNFVEDFTDVVGTCLGRPCDPYDSILWHENLFHNNQIDTDDESFEESFPLQDIEELELALDTHDLANEILANKELALYLLNETENFNK